MYNKRLTALLLAAMLGAYTPVPVMAVESNPALECEEQDAEAETDTIKEEIDDSGSENLPEMNQEEEETADISGADYSDMADVEAEQESVAETANNEMSEAVLAEDAVEIEEQVTSLPANEQASEGQVSVSIYGDTEFTYTGQEIKPFLIVKYDGKQLTEGTEYNVSFKDNVNVGTATVQVEGTGDHDFREDVTFEILPHTLTEDDVQTRLGKYNLRYYKHAYGQNTYLVAIGGKILEKGVDYIVDDEKAFTDNVSGGIATIKGTGNCTGSVELRIPEYDPMNVEVSGDFIYGKDFTPEVSVRIGDRVLTQGNSAGDGDYYVKTTFKNERTAEVEIFGEYEGAEIYDYVTFVASRYTITDADVTLDKNVYEYTGSAIKPAVTVTSNGKTLIGGTDYALKYTNNVKPGTSACVTVTGMGNYTGTVAKSFTIQEKSKSEEPSPSNIVWDDSETDPSKIPLSKCSLEISMGAHETRYMNLVQGINTIKVLHEGKYLEEGKDYTIENKKAFSYDKGDATVKGIGDYTGSAKVKIPEYLKMTVHCYDDFIYGLTPAFPKMEVFMGEGTKNEKKLIQGTKKGEGDYFIDYPENLGPETPARHVVYFYVCGEYDGAEINYECMATISPFTLKDSNVTLKNSAYDYTGNAIIPSVTVSANGKTLKEGKDYDIVCTDNINAGTAKLTVTGKNNYMGEVTKAFTIRQAVKKADPKITLSSTIFTYNGKSQKPVVTIKDGNTVMKSSDYSVQWPTSVNAGTYMAVITFKGDYSGTGSITYKIVPKKISPKVVLSTVTYTYNGTVKKPGVTVKDGNTVLPQTTYTITRPSSVNAGTYKVKVVMKGNYSGTASGSYRIIPQKVTPKVTLSSSLYTYNGKARTPSVAVKAGAKTLRAADYTVSYPKGRKNVGAYKVTVTLKGNYSGKNTVSFKIIPQATRVTAFDPVKNKLAFKVKWKKVAAQADGYQVQYSTDKNFKKDVRTVTVKGAKSTSTTLTKGIKSRRYYYIRVRTYKRAGNATYYSSWAY